MVIVLPKSPCICTVYTYKCMVMANPTHAHTLSHPGVPAPAIIAPGAVAAAVPMGPGFMPRGSGVTGGRGGMAGGGGVPRQGGAPPHLQQQQQPQQHFSGPPYEPQHLRPPPLSSTPPGANGMGGLHTGYSPQGGSASSPHGRGGGGPPHHMQHQQQQQQQQGGGQQSPQGVCCRCVSVGGYVGFFGAAMLAVCYVNNFVRLCLQ